MSYNIYWKWSGGWSFVGGMKRMMGISTVSLEEPDTSRFTCQEIRRNNKRQINTHQSADIRHSAITLSVSANTNLNDVLHFQDAAVWNGGRSVGGNCDSKFWMDIRAGTGDGISCHGCQAFYNLYRWTGVPWHGAKNLPLLQLQLGGDCSRGTVVYVAENSHSFTFKKGDTHRVIVVPWVVLHTHQQSLSWWTDGRIDGQNTRREGFSLCRCFEANRTGCTPQATHRHGVGPRNWTLQKRNFRHGASEEHIGYAVTS